MIQFFKAVFRKINLSTDGDIQIFRKTERHSTNSFYIGCYIITHKTVAPSDGTYKQSPLIIEYNRNAINLFFYYKAEAVLASFGGTPYPIGNFLCAVGFIQA